MADISLRTPNKSRSSAAPAAAEGREPYWDLIELLFFAYRDFVSDPDQLLDKLGFGRAHHRVLHFVNRNPGMKVAELLDILKITKQSLGRVLKQLIDEGYVVQKEGADRRQRLLYVSPAGEALALKLAGLQTARIGRVLDELGPASRETARRFLAGMIGARIASASFASSRARIACGSTAEIETHGDDRREPGRRRASSSRR